MTAKQHTIAFVSNDSRQMARTYSVYERQYRSYTTDCNIFLWAVSFLKVILVALFVGKRLQLIMPKYNSIYPWFNRRILNRSHLKTSAKVVLGFSGLQKFSFNSIEKEKV